jgi:hypothetical protein
MCSLHLNSWTAPMPTLAASFKPDFGPLIRFEKVNRAA